MKRKKNIEQAETGPTKRTHHASPRVDALLPELRSNTHWTLVQSSAIQPSAQLIIVWGYGVPLNKVPNFHIWLRANEATLAQDCDIANATANPANDSLITYRGTYLDLDGGAPMYRTYWGYSMTDRDKIDAAILRVIQPVAAFRRMRELRSFWTPDSARSEHVYGIAQNFRDAETPPAGTMWPLDMEASAKPYGAP